ncbi:toll-like receptor 4 [Physella acuta]|uniref:toll-like receptor 4 n=1 Tax=Physella acuta TaxID=109671 RepID=UPI0027DC1B9A|nr:toll-like receptor 4 [Physella acuta]
MTEITLDGIAIDIHRLDIAIINQDSYLRDNITSSLTQICVQEFTLKSSYLLLIYMNALYSSAWNRCIKNIDLSDNPLSGQMFAMLQILRLKHLERVFMSDTFRSCFNLQPFWEHPDYATVPITLRQLAVEKIDFKSDRYTPQYRTMPNHGLSNTLNEECATISGKLSASLKYVHVRRMFDKNSLNIKIDFIDGYNITYLDISECGLSKFNCPILGLENLRTVILSANDLSQLPETIFDATPLLERLATSTCKLQNSMIINKGNRYFSALNHLRWIDLSSNALYFIAPNTFMYNPYLTAVSFANNRFQNIPVDLSYTPQLVILDMSYNSLTTIHKPTRDKLDDLVYRNGYFKLNLDGNIFSCHCENIQFLTWLQNTLVTLDNNRNYTCMDKDGYQKPTDYTNGVFIGYADQDYKFTCDLLLPYVETTLGLKAFVRDRDLLPSSDVARGLVEAVNSSWRIILVFNENYLRADDWMWFTIRCAIYSQTPANPSRIVVMVHKQHLHHLPDELLSAVLDENVIMVSTWELDYVIRQKLRTLLLQPY